jgi:hypothetical protein
VFHAGMEETPGPGEPLRPTTIIKNSMPWRLNNEKSGELSVAIFHRLQFKKRKRKKE